MQTSRSLLLAGLSVVLTAAGSLRAADDFTWSGRIADGKAIEIKGVNGGIVATGAPGGAVEVTAVKKGRKSDPAQVRIEVVEHAGGVTLCAVLQEGAAGAQDAGAGAVERAFAGGGGADGGDCYRQRLANGTKSNIMVHTYRLTIIFLTG